MANTLLPIEERDLTPQQVEHLDSRRRRGQLFLVVCFQCLIIGTLLTLWAGQDATYSPGWAHPMLFLDLAVFGAGAIFGAVGLSLRRGSNEFISY